MLLAYPCFIGIQSAVRIKGVRRAQFHVIVILFMAICSVRGVTYIETYIKQTPSDDCSNRIIPSCDP